MLRGELVLGFLQNVCRILPGVQERVNANSIAMHG